jgi:hypothetical protein
MRESECVGKPLMPPLNCTQGCKQILLTHRDCIAERLNIVVKWRPVGGFGERGWNWHDAL